MSDQERDNGNHQQNSSKRIRIPDSQQASTSIPPSPPRFVSLEELMSAAKGMTNMSLAHEIAVNKDFKLEKVEPPDNSIEKIVKETMHKAFWDTLQKELQEDPPKYSQAFLLLQEVKDSLLNLLLPQHTRLKSQIDEVLNIDLIKQQAENSVLNFQEYAQFVISIMGRMCAPVRDSRILELTQMTEIVPIFRGILETLELMRIDMANFTIDIMRPQITANSVAYEKKKFADFLRLQKDGLAKTEVWLKRHLSSGDEQTNQKKQIEAVINDAYLDLVQWDKSEPLPEVLTMDEARIKSCTEESRLLIRVATVLVLTFSYVGSNLVSVAEWKINAKKMVLTLLSPPDPEELTTVAAKLSDNIAEAAKKYNITIDSSSDLQSVIAGADDSENPVHKLLEKRILDFLKFAISSRTAERLQIPPGLSVLQDELTQLAGNFLRMVSHNRAVFGEYYVSILEKTLPSYNNK